MTTITATKTINVFIADPLSEDGIFPLRQEKDLEFKRYYRHRSCTRRINGKNC